MTASPAWRTFALDGLQGASLNPCTEPGEGIRGVHKKCGVCRHAVNRQERQTHAWYEGTRVGEAQNPGPAGRTYAEAVRYGRRPEVQKGQARSPTPVGRNAPQRECWFGTGCKYRLKFCPFAHNTPGVKGQSTLPRARSPSVAQGGRGKGTRAQAVQPAQAQHRTQAPQGGGKNWDTKRKANVATDSRLTKEGEGKASG